MAAEYKSQLAELFPRLLTDGDPAINELFASSQTVSLDAGQFVFHAGDSCKAFLILIAGNVRVQITSASGREVTLYRIGAGGSCLLTTSCLFSRDRYPAEAITESDVQALAVPRAKFEQALEQSAQFRQFVFDGFSARLTHVIKKLEELAFTSVDSRLAAILLEFHGRRVEEITHQHLAVELGTAREVVSRHLKRFENEGWVRLGRGRVKVIDAACLQRIIEAVLCD